MKPPFIKQCGVFHLPTCVNNVESLSLVAPLLLDDEGYYKSQGTPDCPGTKMISVCGNVKRPINSMADLNGLKIRVPETKACQDFYTAIGAIPAAIATSETLAALEQGTVDGVDNSIYNMKSMVFWRRSSTSPC